MDKLPAPARGAAGSRGPGAVVAVPASSACYAGVLILDLYLGRIASHRIAGLSVLLSCWRAPPRRATPRRATPRHAVYLAAAGRRV